MGYCKDPGTFFLREASDSLRLVKTNIQASKNTHRGACFVRNEWDRILYTLMGTIKDCHLQTTGV